MDIKSCDYCGRSFNRLKKFSDKQWKGRKYCSTKCSSTKHNISESDLRRLYIDELKSSTEIGKKLGISSTHILRMLKSFGIHARSPSESKTIALNKPEVRMKMSLARLGKPLSDSAKKKLSEMTGSRNANYRGGMTLSNGYLYFTASTSNGEHAGKALHAVIAEWLYERKPLQGEHVHHIDGNKLNNHPENIVIMSDSDHGKIHAVERVNNIGDIHERD